MDEFKDIHSQEVYSEADNVSDVYNEKLCAAQLRIKELERRLARYELADENDGVQEEHRLDGNTQIRIEKMKASENRIIRTFNSDCQLNKENISDKVCAGVGQPDVRGSVGGSSRVQDSVDYFVTNKRISPNLRGDGGNMNQIFPTLAGLPKREIIRFNGDPMKYWVFIRNFQSNVMKLTDDPEIRLSYLIHYCEGEARDAIESCSILDPELGFPDALETLEKRFGRPHLIAKTYIDELVNGPSLRMDEFDALNSLAGKMKACLNTLHQLRYEADLNASVTLSAIIKRLPYAVQSEWFRRAAAILRIPKEPTFKDLYELVCDYADISAAQGKYVAASTSKTVRTFRPSASEVRNSRAAAFAIQKVESQPSRYLPKCVSCEEVHYLDQCQIFRTLNDQLKMTTVTTHNLCELCLKPNHVRINCRSRNCCGMNGCKARHHPLLHNAMNEHSVPQANVNAAKGFNNSVALGVIPVRIRGAGVVIETNALLDSGSDSSLIEENLLRQLKLNSKPATLKLSTVTNEANVFSSVTSIELLSLEGDRTIRVNEVWSVSRIPQTERTLSTGDCIGRWEHLKGLNFPHSNNSKVGLLIGLNVPEAHWVLEQRCGYPSDPFATRTPLGWVVMGPMSCRHENVSYINTTLTTIDDISVFLERMYELEFSESHTFRPAMSVEDKNALKQMENSIVKRGSQYEINLPWKVNCPSLPNNFIVAYHRFMALRKRLQKDPELRQLYVTAVEDYLSKGFAEPVNPDDIYQRDNVWYVPHHAVTHPNKPGKVRVVFDCASSYQGVSINQQLLKGPDLVNSLIGVLLRFRVEPVAVVADIEAMFHQVKIPKRDRNYFRFLWCSCDHMNAEPEVFQMTVHLFGATSSPSCASYALRRTIEDCSCGLPEEIVRFMIRSFYVDDCLFSCSSTDEARKMVIQFRDVLAKGGFNLHKWRSNEPRVLPATEDPNSVSSSFSLNLDQSNLHHTLGLRWDLRGDFITFYTTEHVGECTRRKLLSFVASIYDPLGLISPVLLPAKQLLQSFVRKRLGWDTPINSEEKNLWDKFVTDICRLEQVRIPRCIKGELSGHIHTSLHCFSDASELGYGAAVYARLVDQYGRVKCSLLQGKSRVSPIKAITIPRLELTAAVLAVRLGIQVAEELYSETLLTFWTDSMVVLQLMRCTTKRFATFIANRLSVIHQFSTPSQWRYVTTSDNPADLASRGVRVADVGNLNRWFEGPKFLMLEEGKWPNPPSNLIDVPEEWFKDDTISINQVLIEAPWFDRFSGCHSWTALRRRVAILLRFKRYIMTKRRGNLNSLLLGPLKLGEIQEAEIEMFRHVQMCSFANEIDLVRNNEPNCSSRRLKRIASPLSRLCPFLENGTLRVGGRLNWSSLPYDAKHPILLPPNHFVTQLLIRDCHERNGHVGSSQVLSELRQRYWIVRGVSAIRRVLRTCAKCRIWNARPCEQQMAPVIEDRLMAYQPAFTVVGIDYFGPLMVKSKRSLERRYGCIFTCLSIRAVHIELTCTLDADSFLCAFSRFAARRGVPCKIYSDNGQNFHTAETEIKSLISSWDKDKISRSLMERNCEWIFNPPYGSHRGGAWERLIRSIRTTLRLVLGEQPVDDEVLRTTLIEIEGILNRRPLIPNPNEPDDFGTLSPNQLLTLSSGRPVDFKECTLPIRLSRRWRQVQHLSDQFWQRWLKLYLPTLHKRQRWQETKRGLRVGDLVLVRDMHASKGLWPKGIVMETKTGRDGLVREVLVRTNKGLFRRDIRQLCLLEATLNEEGQEESNEVTAGGV